MWYGSSKGHDIEVDLEYTKTLCELHNDYSLASDKIETKKEILPNYQLNIADFYDTPTDKNKVKNTVPNIFDIEKYVVNYETWTYVLKDCLRLGLKLKRYIVCEELFNESQWLKPYVKFKTPKRVHAFFLRRFFIRKWASKMPKSLENLKKISGLKCLGCNF